MKSSKRLREPGQTAWLKRGGNKIVESVTLKSGVAYYEFATYHPQQFTTCEEYSQSECFATKEELLASL